MGSLEEVMDAVDRACAPDVMTKQEAVEFLIDVRDQVIGRLEALQDEIRNREAENGESHDTNDGG